MQHDLDKLTLADDDDIAQTLAFGLTHIDRVAGTDISGACQARLRLSE
jgi:hypothetical protein